MEVLCMAAKKRASTRSKLLKRAVKAGRSAIREANKRVPPDLRKQIERTVQDGQKTFHTAIKQVQTRLDRTARQADLDKAMKRLDELAKQVRKIAAGAAASSTSRPARRKPATRKAATRKPAARKPAARKTAARKPAAKRTTARRTTSRSTQPATPSPTPEPGEMDGA
jgi:polyhydroxyalkanoate synthesis regulator phasin